MSILVVEDETALARGLKFNFEQEGYEVVLCDDGQKAVDLFKDRQDDIDLIILDLMLPSLSGYEACRAIREIDKHVPIMVLSARSLSEDRALAFDCGSDQYVTKPFALPELLSRVRNLIERRLATAGLRKKPARDVCRIGDARVDFDKFEVSAGGKTHRLTTKEAQLLRYFIENEARVLSRIQILENVWQDDRQDVTLRTIDNFVLRLRRFVEPNPAEPQFILSVRGTGYRFVAKPDDARSDEDTL